MYKNRHNGEIAFYYGSEELFNEVSLLSAFIVKNIVSESGSMLDQFGITGDERDAYDVCVKQVMPSIYEEMMKVTSFYMESPAFVPSDEVKSKEDDELGREIATYIVFNISDNGSHNTNVLPLVDDTLSNCLKYGILAEYYSVNLNAELLAFAREKFANNLAQLRQRLFQLKRKPVSSQFV